MSCNPPYMENGEDSLDVWLTTISADQAKIDEYLSNSGLLKNKRVLHVGCGQSSVAYRFHSQFTHADGIAIWKNEVKLGNDLNLDNYNCYEVDKYMLDQLSVLGTYDVIIDNNIKSYMCCQEHYEDWFGWMLDNSSIIITHDLGMRSRSILSDADIDKAGGFVDKLSNGVVLIT